jgi:hypothetical protein
MGVGFPKVFVVNGPDVADYEDLVNLPAINSTVLSGNQTGDDLGLLDKALLDKPLGVPSLDAGSKLQIAEMPLATKEEAEDGTVETGLMTPLRTKQAIDALVPTMTGATAEDDGTSGLVPAPSAGDEAKFLTGAGTYSAIPKVSMSETEYDTGKLWIDDRPIFGIVVDIGALPNDDEKRVASGVPVGATVLSVNGYTKGTATTLCIPSVSVPVFYDDATQELVITTDSDMTSFTESFVVLEYIKAV